MRVAVATQAGDVAPHFGRCPQYTLATVRDGQVTEIETVPNPGHQPGVLPGYLAELGVDVIVSGGMGSRAQRLFDEAGIGYIVGARGTVDECLLHYAEGNLQAGEDLCEH